MESCFYRSERFTIDYFTPKIKAAGNAYCLCVIAISALGIFLQLKGLRQLNDWKKKKWLIQLEAVDLLFGGIILTVTTGLWFWANSVAAPSNDEVFSALNCAGIHPFQSMSYYMLPNNHVLFNLLNNIVFHAVDNKVASGRVLSLFFYWSIILILFSLFRSVIKNKWLALLAALTLSVQFPIWCFGCQGRGYELVALAGWVSLLAFMKYTAGREGKWLYVMLIAGCIGYFAVPVFMYFHAAVLVFAFCMQVAGRKADWRFWKFQAVCIMVVFLLYLPCFCFSGVQAITGNPWLTIEQPYSEILSNLVDTCHEYMIFTFCNIGRGNFYPDLVLFLLPFSLLFYRNNPTAKFFGRFYCCMWGILVLFVIKMKVYPMDRALPGQFSVTLALVIYALYLALSALAAKMHFPRLSAIVLSIALLLMQANFVDQDRFHGVHYQCHFHVDTWEKLLSDGINTSIPRGRSVAFSDESFYFYFLCKNYGYDVTKCARGNEQYMIKLRHEPFFIGKEEDYVMLQPVGDYGIYKKK